MYWRYAKIKISEIAPWRWFLIIAFYLLVLIYDSIGILAHFSQYQLSLLEVIIYELNDYFSICYYFLFPIIILSSDIYSCSNEPFHNHTLMKLGTRHTYYLANALYICLISFIAIALFIITTIAVYTIAIGKSAQSTRITMELFGDPNTFLSAGLIQSISLLLLRFIFINSGIFLINLRFNKPIGFLFAFLISFIDYWLYEIFQIMNPLYILPIEHTRIFYTEAVAPAFENASRVGLGVSYFYWTILITIVNVLTWRIVAKKDFITREVVY